MEWRIFFWRLADTVAFHFSFARRMLIWFVSHVPNSLLDLGILHLPNKGGGHIIQLWLTHARKCLLGVIWEKRGGLFFLPWTLLCDEVVLRDVRAVFYLRVRRPKDEKPGSWVAGQKDRKSLASCSLWGSGLKVELPVTKSLKWPLNVIYSHGPGACI